jgi:hypothetical protein
MKWIEKAVNRSKWRTFISASNKRIKILSFEAKLSVFGFILKVSFSKGVKN